MWNFLGGALGALGSVYGAQVQSDTQQQINAQNIAAQEQMNSQNLAQQLNFAQNGAGWNLSSLVNTAKQVGINPLSALGVGGSSFSNLVAPQATAPQVGDLYSKAGQSLGRAVSAIQSPEDRAVSQVQVQQQLEKGSLENDFLRAQINKINGSQPGLAPGVPAFSEPGVKAGVTPDVQLTQTASGDTTVTPPKDIAALGFFHPSSWSWWARNGLAPVFNSDYAPQSQRGKSYNPFTMTYSDKDQWSRGLTLPDYRGVGDIPASW